MTPLTILVIFIAVAMAMAMFIAGAPAITATRAGKVLGFVALFILPSIATWWGVEAHIERSKQTAFCLSCHIMEPYGHSLYVDDKKWIPAAHFQNHRIPVDEACYTCHTDYTLFGGFKAKLRGMHHVWAQYVTGPKLPIHLYEPYNNRECLHCHAGARGFEEEPTHQAMMDDLKSGQTSCLTSGCHDTVHNVEHLKEATFWKPQG